MQGGLAAAKRDGGSDGKATRREVTKQLRTLLDSLCAAMHPAPLFAALKATAEDSKDRTARAALRTFSSAAEALPRPLDDATAAAAAALAASAADLTAPASSAGAAAAPAATRHAAAHAVDAAAGAVAGAACAAELARCAAPLAACAADAAAGAAVRAAALGALARVTYAAGPAAVPHVPAAAEAVLACAEESLSDTSGDAETELKLAGALAALRSFVTTLPGMFSPYLPRTLAALYHPAALKPSNGLCRVAAAEARAALPQSVEFRLLLPALTQQVAAAERAGTEPLVATLGLLCAALDKMKITEVEPFVEAVAELILGVLDLRGRGAGELAIGDIEAAASKVSFVLRMHADDVLLQVQLCLCACFAWCWRVVN